MLLIQSHNDLLFYVILKNLTFYNYIYRPYTLKHNSMILLSCISYIVSSNDMFRL